MLQSDLVLLNPYPEFYDSFIVHIFNIDPQLGLEGLYTVTRQRSVTLCALLFPTSAFILSTPSINEPTTQTILTALSFEKPRVPQYATYLYVNLSYEEKVRYSPDSGK